MTTRYSPSTRGFYETELHGAAIPSDSVYVTPARHAQLLAAQAEGATIEPSPGTGNPVIVPTPAPSAQALAASAKTAVRSEADKRIQNLMSLPKQVAILRDHVLNGTPLDASTLAAFAAVDAVQSAADTIDADIDQRSVEELRTYPVRDNNTWPEAL
ncbi:MAG: hypothetical protein KKC79_00525 [Gammaproteobacteria bacterium]|nr:hypothetical protein [Alphaproteobacteria bacterium]MBU2407114.1 hypothetical protein [Gammaproteobacteria bacterium]